MTLPIPLARHRHRRRLLVLPLVAVAALIAALFATAGPAAAQGTFAQVTSFGSNPGNLQMYSYVPSGLPAGAPLVVALHGCTQNATDYYDDSGWPKYADLWDFAVVFPQQQSSNNSEDCFDWYTPSDYDRGDGEAESIIQMVQYAESSYGVNPSRIYITGLSAGGGMTDDMLASYPDVFAGGSIDSGLPADCATSLTNAYTCEYDSLNDTSAQLGALAKNADPSYSGPYPRIAIWQGTADTTVAPVNATEEMDQWTDLWGISQTASSTQSLTGGTTESIYNDSSGNPAVESYSISGMSHGLAVEPGSATADCGTTASYFLNYICSSYYTALFFGLNSSGSSSPSPTPTPTTSSPTPTPTPTTPTPTPTPTTPTPTPTPLGCWTTNNYDQVAAGRAYQNLGYAYADGSNQNMGLWNLYQVTSLEETKAGYYVIVSSCPS